MLASLRVIHYLHLSITLSSMPSSASIASCQTKIVRIASRVFSPCLVSPSVDSHDELLHLHYWVLYNDMSNQGKWALGCVQVSVEEWLLFLCLRKP